MLFIINREDAGKLLAKKIKESVSYESSNTVIYALPRGGVVLGFEIAKELKCPLDIVVTRKIGHPDNPEYALCAITAEGDLFCNELEKPFLDPKWLKSEAEKEKQEAQRRSKVYLQDRPHIPANGKTAILVDDGIATGLTIFAAVELLKKEDPKNIIVAVPVAPYDVVANLQKKVKVVVLEVAEQYLGSVSAYYRDFPQVTDRTVIDLLNKSAKEYGK